MELGGDDNAATGGTNRWVKNWQPRGVCQFYLERWRLHLAWSGETHLHLQLQWVHT